MSAREMLKADLDIMPEDVIQVLNAMWAITREREVKTDHFWSKENQDHLSKSISDYENGITAPVIKTMEELETYEN